jgi:hypothetical protein
MTSPSNANPDAFVTDEGWAIIFGRGDQFGDRILGLLAE